MAPPKVFVSYSHDSEAHKEWVLKLATALRDNGVDAILDRWDLSLGQDTVAFMSNGIASSDRVLLVCSENYVKKADGQVGGAGYEGLIVTGELVQNIDTKKFIPVIRGNASAKKMPTFLGPRKYIDFNADADYPVKLEELLREIHGQRSAVKPPIGPNPFSGAASPAPPSTRVAGPSGLTSSGEAVLADAWFVKHEAAAAKGLAALGPPGAMELRFALHDPISKSQLELLNAVRASEIQTFGWPIAALLENRDEYRPRPDADGIVAEVAIKEKALSDRSSYDYWSVRSNGDFFLLQSLFEDERAERKLFVDTRIVRVTESLMFCSNLYAALGVVPEARVSVRVGHRGLAGRELDVASPRRIIIPAKTQENVSEAQIVDSVGQIRPRLVEHVMQIVEPLFMLFDFKKFDRKVYEEIVNSFAAGRVT